MLKHIFNEEVSQAGLQDMLIDQEMRLSGSSWVVGLWTNGISDNVIPYIANGSALVDSSSIVISAFVEEGVFDTTSFSTSLKQPLLQPMLAEGKCEFFVEPYPKLVIQLFIHILSIVMFLFESSSVED